MSQWDDEFIRLVDNFVVETKDPRVLQEISELDRESQLLGISFYDMYCVVLQDVKGHQTLVAEFKTYVSLKKAFFFHYKVISIKKFFLPWTLFRRLPMGDFREPQFLKKKRGFFILASEIYQKVFDEKGGSLPAVLPIKEMSL